MQQSIVAVVVIACLAYTIWTLVPSRAKNWVRRVVLHRPPKAADGCGACGGCAATPASSSDRGSEHVVHVVRH